MFHFVVVGGDSGILAAWLTPQHINLYDQSKIDFDSICHQKIASIVFVWFSLKIWSCTSRKKKNMYYSWHCFTEKNIKLLRFFSVHVQNKHTLALTLTLIYVCNTLIECDGVLILPYIFFSTLFISDKIIRI